MGLKAIECEGMDWTHGSQNRTQWQWKQSVSARHLVAWSRGLSPLAEVLTALNKGRYRTNRSSNKSNNCRIHNYPTIYCIWLRRSSKFPSNISMSASYCGGPKFKWRHRDWLFWLKLFVVKSCLASISILTFMKIMQDKVPNFFACLLFSSLFKNICHDRNNETQSNSEVQISTFFSCLEISLTCCVYLSVFFAHILKYGC
jgi:hypothetical protein